MRRVGSLFLTGTVALAMVLPVQAEELSAVVAKLDKAWKQQKSITAKMDIKTHIEMGPMSVDGNGTGTFELLNKDGKQYVRVEIENKLVQKNGDKQATMVQKQMLVVDGKYAYRFQQMGERKMAVKSDVDEAIVGGPKAMLDDYAKQHDLKVLPSQTIDGAKTCVIEATPKQSDRKNKAVLYFQEKSGVLVKMVQFGPDEKPMTTVSYHDIKLGADIDPSRFVFKAPEGVEVVDQTKKAGEKSAEKKKP